MVSAIRRIEGFTGSEPDEKTITLAINKAARKLRLEPPSPTFELLPAKDSWVVVVVTGKKKLSPVVHDRQPFAVTNPIFLDLNGNGVYDAPASF